MGEVARDFDILSAAGPLAPWLVDPNSTLGLRWEGSRARAAGKPKDANPYSTWCAGSLAELHWWEGWALEGQRDGGKARPNLAAAKAFATRTRNASTPPNEPSAAMGGEIPE